jgi:glucokinase
MVTLGTGIGLGLVLNGELYQGSNGLVEGGHMIISSGSGGRLCGCGQRGCVEAYSSASSTARRLKDQDEGQGEGQGEGNSSFSPSSVCKSASSAKDVFERYSANDPLAIKVVKETAEYLAILCINICRVVDPVSLILLISIIDCFVD